jgi:quinol monooxygenase YgiN
MPAMLLQATAEVPDFDQFCDAVRWLSGTVGHPDGFISLEIMRAIDAPNRVTFLERWDSVEAFQAAYAKYDMEQRAEFLSRAGIDAERFTPTLWAETELVVLTDAD